MSEHTRNEMSNPTSVNVKLTVVGVDDVPIQNAKVAVFLTSDRTKVLNTETDASGVAETTYAGPTPVEVEVRCRKAATKDSPRYVNYSSIQTIRADKGLDFDIILIKDRNFNKIS